MTFKQLEAFYWAASSASFLTAAERLNVAQSSLSKRIGELEASLGRRLFDRGAHRARLTDAGRALLPHARALLAAAEATRAAVSDPAHLSGQCRIGVGEQASLTWLPDLIAAASGRFPHLAIEPSVDVGAALEAALDAGTIDLAVVAAPAARAGLASRPLARLDFRWAASERLLGAGAATAERLRDLPLITTPPGAGATRIVDRWLAGSGIAPPSRLTCNSMAAIAGLVSAGVGISCFPLPWLAEMERRGAAVSLAADVPLDPLDYHLHWRRDDARASVAAVRTLVEEVADFFRPNALWHQRGSPAVQAQ